MLIDDILDIARIEAGQFNISVQGMDLVATVVESISIVATMAERRRVAIHHRARSTPPGPGRSVAPDTVRGESADQRREVQTSRRCGAYRTARLGNGRVRLTVEDTGIGIHEDQIGDLLQPFKRLHPDNQEIEGVGIGLALVMKQLVEAMQGTITVENRAGGGGTRFPRRSRRGRPDPAHAAAPGARRAAPAGIDADETVAAPKVALYVEDNPANVHLMRTLFDTLPATELKIAYSGEKRAGDRRCGAINLIILDINLPGMDGFETMNRLKQGVRTASVPGIGLSARATEQDRNRASALGFYRYFTKPMNLPEFIESVRTVL